jgi:DNA repair protein RecO (recombination protein O)
MLRAPVESFARLSWPSECAVDLRKFLLQTLQRHLEKKLVTAAMLDRVST